MNININCRDSTFNFIYFKYKNFYIEENFIEIIDDILIFNRFFYSIEKNEIQNYIKKLNKKNRMKKKFLSLDNDLDRNVYYLMVFLINYQIKYKNYAIKIDNIYTLKSNISNKIVLNCFKYYTFLKNNISFSDNELMFFIKQLKDFNCSMIAKCLKYKKNNNINKLNNIMKKYKNLYNFRKLINYYYHNVKYTRNIYRNIRNNNVK